MNGIPLESGVNNCRWNIDGKCTNKQITRAVLPAAFTRDWESKQSCTLTILGVHKCGGYTPQKG